MLRINILSRRLTLGLLAGAFLPAAAPSADAQPSPAAAYCTQNGGRGGWALESDPQDVVSFCVFSDLPMIDVWGLLYHTENIIRGKDLTTVLRYKPAT